MPELTDDQIADLKEEAQYAIFATATGEQLTPWITPDNAGEITFDFKGGIDFEIGMKIFDGTIILGEHTHVEVLEEEEYELED